MWFVKLNWGGGYMYVCVSVVCIYVSGKYMYPPPPPPTPQKWIQTHYYRRFMRTPQKCALHRQTPDSPTCGVAADA